LKPTPVTPNNLVVGAMLKCQRPRATIFSATEIALFTPPHFGDWSTKHKSF
jgi:hypothetical protein